MELTSFAYATDQLRWWSWSPFVAGVLRDIPEYVLVGGALFSCGRHNNEIKERTYHLNFILIHSGLSGILSVVDFDLSTYRR